MKYPTIFHLISEVFKKAKADCVLIGGFAVNYYKVTRHTADVDFLIVKEDFEKMKELFEKEGFKRDYSQEVFARLRGDNLYLMDIDFMFVDRDTLDKIIKEGRRITIAGQKFIVPDLKHLIALKLHSIKYNFKFRQYKDIPDIIELIKVNKVDVKSRDFKNLCLKYGTEEIYHKITESV